jgi:hypothetical protein
VTPYICITHPEFEGMMNYLKAVFWDNPQFAEEKSLRKHLKQKQEKSLYMWIMYRFLEHGRVVDTLKYFTINEIAENIPKLSLTSYTLKKWKRMIELYGKH